MKQYTCLNVTFSGSKKTYSYLTDDSSIEKGDFVIVPSTSDTVVRVTDTRICAEEDLPFDLKRMRRIKGLYKKAKNIHYERPISVDVQTVKDDSAGYRTDLFQMLEGVEHEYHECLTEEDLKEFEERNRIRLPIEYRRFLREIGNGIRFLEPNPEFRYSCGRANYREIYGINPKKSRKHYKYSFHFGKEGYQDDRPFYPECVFNKGEDLEDVCLACDQRYICPDGIDEFTENARYHGTLELTYAGCGYYYHLILNGPHRGEVWASGDDWFVPHKESFSEFLEWLLESESY